MKSVIAAIGIVIVSWALPVSAQAPVRFADMAWGSTKAETRQKLEGLGFRFQQEDRGGDLQFAGALPSLNENAVISAVFTPGNKLVKVRANVTAPPSAPAGWAKSGRTT